MSQEIDPTSRTGSCCALLVLCLFVFGTGGAWADCTAESSNLAIPNNCNFANATVASWSTAPSTGVLSHNNAEGSDALGSLQCVAEASGPWIWCTTQTCVENVSPSTEYNLAFDLKMTSPPATQVGSAVPFSQIRYREYPDGLCQGVALTGSLVADFLSPIPPGIFTQLLGTVTTTGSTQSVLLEARVLNQDCNVVADCGYTVVYDEILFGPGLTPVSLEAFSVE